MSLPAPRVRAQLRRTEDHDDHDETELALAASGQKMSIYCIVANFVLSSAARSTSMPPLLLWALYSAVAVVSLIGVVRICSGLRMRTNRKIVFMVLSFIPLLNLVALIWLSMRTTRTLRSHGWSVGLAGCEVVTLWSHFLVLLATPVSAVAAGLVVGLTHRGRAPDDGALIRQFLLMLAIFVAATWGISRLPSVQLRIDPRLQLQSQLDANAAYAAIKKNSPDDLHQVDAALADEFARGAKLPQALLRVRPLLVTLARDRLGFVDRATALQWSHVTLDMLTQLNARDSQLCLRALVARSGTPHPLSRDLLDQESSAAFIQAVADIYRSAAEGMARRHAPSERDVGLRALQSEYRTLMERMRVEFGDDVDRTRDASWREDNAGRYCGIVTRKLQLMLARETPMAASLLRNYLRSDPW